MAFHSLCPMAKSVGQAMQQKRRISLQSHGRSGEMERDELDGLLDWVVGSCWCGVSKWIREGEVSFNCILETQTVKASLTFFLWHLPRLYTTPFQPSCFRMF